MPNKILVTGSTTGIGKGILERFHAADWDVCVTGRDSTRVKESKYSYNETQLKIMANCSRFVTVCGGNSILSSLFGGTVISYIHKGKELRPNYFGPNSYFRKLSNANIIPVIDNSVVKTGIHDYSQLMEQVKIQF